MQFSDLFETRSSVRIRCKQRFPTNDARALRFEKRAQIWCKKRRTVGAPIEFQEKASVRFQKSRPDVVDKKFPVSLCPFQPLSVFAARDAMETDAMRGNQVEFLAEIRQGRLRIDAGDHAVDVEELGRAPEERLIIGIEPETFVAEHLAEVKKITRAAAKIQDVKWWRTIKPKVLDALYVNANPIVGVLIRVDLPRIRPIGIMFAQIHQFRLINRGENAPRTYRMYPPRSVLPQAFRRVASEELLKFARQSHAQRMQ